MQNFDEIKEDFAESKTALYENFKENLSKIMKAPSVSAIKEIGADLISDAKETSESDNILKERQKNIYNVSSE